MTKTEMQQMLLLKAENENLRDLLRACKHLLLGVPDFDDSDYPVSWYTTRDKLFNLMDIV